MGIPLGRKTRETVDKAVGAVREAADRTSGFIMITLGLSVLALAVAFVALVRGGRTAAA